MMFKHRTCVFMTVMVALAVLAGCSDDDPPTTPEPTTGTIVIEAPGFDAPMWILSGPDGYQLAGDGEREIADLEPGGYAIDWRTDQACLPPADMIGQLVAGETLTFSGVYAMPGTVRIEIEPWHLNVNWTLTGPVGFEQSGQDDWSSSWCRPGEYQVQWTMPGTWEVVSVESGPLVLAEEGEIVFRAEFSLPPTPLEPPTTPDNVMHNFVVTYGEERLEEFGEVLSEDFQFILKDHGSIIDYDEMMAITELMMTGQAGYGGIAFEGIEVNRLVGLEVWTETPAEDPDFGAFEGSYDRPYDVSFDFPVLGQSLTYQVRGLVVFYVMNEGTVDEPVYRIIGCTDNTNGLKATEASSWSAILTLFN